MSEHSEVEKSVKSITFGNMHNKTELTYFSSLLNQRRVTFRALYAYGCTHICKWDVNETGQIYKRKFDLIVTVCFKNSLYEFCSASLFLFHHSTRYATCF